jgi:hypothetical protein
MDIITNFRHILGYTIVRNLVNKVSRMEMQIYDLHLKLEKESDRRIYDKIELRKEFSKNLPMQKDSGKPKEAAAKKPKGVEIVRTLDKKMTKLEVSQRSLIPKLNAVQKVNDEKFEDIMLEIAEMKHAQTKLNSREPHLKAVEIVRVLDRKVTNLEASQRSLMPKLKAVQEVNVQKFEDIFLEINEVKQAQTKLASKNNLTEEELKFAQKKTQDEVSLVLAKTSALEKVASWKVNLDKFAEVSHHIDKVCEKVPYMEAKIAEMTKQRYKIESQVSQLTNDTERHFGAVKQKLKKSKEISKEVKADLKRVTNLKASFDKKASEQTNFSNSTTVQQYVIDPRVIANCEIYGLTLDEVPRPDYIPPKFEKLRNVWNSLCHFDYRHCLRALANRK